MFTPQKTTRRFGLIFNFTLELLADFPWKRFFGGADEKPDENPDVALDDGGVDEEPNEIWSVTDDDGGVDEEPDEIWSVTDDDGGVDEEPDEIWS